MGLGGSYYSTSGTVTVLTEDGVTTSRGGGFRLTVDLPAGNMVVNGVKQPGIGDHDIVVAFRNGQGQGTVLFSNRVSQATNLVITFPASLVAATYGGNTIEVVRTGPAAPLTSYWIAYDHVRLEAVAGGVGRKSPVKRTSASFSKYSVSVCLISGSFGICTE